MKSHISDIMLERYCLDELSPKDKLHIENMISSDSEIKERINAILHSNNEIIKSYPPEYISNQVQSRLKEDNKKTFESKNKKIFGLSFSLAGVCISAVAVYFVLPIISPFNRNNVVNEQIAHTTIITSDGVRFKGDESRLYLYKKTQGEPESLIQNSSVTSGDTVQIGFQTRKPYAIIVSIDGRGGVTLHYPSDEYTSTSVETGKKMLLDKSYRLDDAPLFERFFIVASDIRIDTKYILDRAKSFARSSKAAKTEPFNIAGAQIESFVLVKE